MTRRRDRSVLIVGAGIGGLCLAQALLRAGIDVTVYERDEDPDSRADRYRLHLNPAGLRALRACLPTAAWQEFQSAAGRSGGGFGFLDDQLRQLVVVEDSIMYPGSDGARTIDRAALRAVLLSGLGRIVCWGKTFQRYAELPDGRVEVFFTDGSTATTDLLIGADGAGSGVRRQAVPGAEPVETGAVGVGLKLPLESATLDWLPARLAVGENLILTRKPYFLFTSVLRGGRTPDYLLCAFVAARTVLPPTAAGGLQQHVGALTESWHPNLHRVITECPADSVARYPFRTAVRIPELESPAVVLLGDAAHCMPPTGGLGANTALRDAYLLSRLITSGSSLESYQREMPRYAAAAVKASATSLRQGLNTALIPHLGARLWFRSCARRPALRRTGFGRTWAGPAARRDWEDLP